MYKRLRKQKGQSIMDNQQTLVLLDTQDTEQRQIKQKTQHRKLWKKRINTNPTKHREWTFVLAQPHQTSGVNPDARGTPPNIGSEPWCSRNPTEHREWTLVLAEPHQISGVNPCARGTPPNIGSEPWCSWRVNSSCFLYNTCRFTHIYSQFR